MEKTLEQELLQNKQNIQNLNGGILPLLKGKYLFLAVFLSVLAAAMVIISINFKNVGYFFIPLAGAALYLEYLFKKARQNFMRRFARLNAFQFRETAAIEEIAAPYLNLGHNRRLDNMVSGIYQNCPIKFFDFHCDIGGPKTKKTISFTVCEIKFKAVLPHIFLDARHHFFGEDSVFSTEEHNAKNDKRIVKLEGNFNEYFTLYAPKEYEIETLQIFSPNIMAELIDHGKLFSLEFFNNHLYIYSRETVDTGKNLYYLYSLALLLISKLAHGLEKISVR